MLLYPVSYILFHQEGQEGHHHPKCPIKNRKRKEKSVLIPSHSIRPLEEELTANTNRTSTSFLF